MLELYRKVVLSPKEACVRAVQKGSTFSLVADVILALNRYGEQMSSVLQILAVVLCMKCC